MNMSTTPITIGTLAKSAGVGVETIRFYEREGLLPKPARSKSGYRSYPIDAVERVRFIRRAKDLGFTLDEVSELLALKVSHGKSCASVRKRALNKADAIDQKLKDLRSMRKALEVLLQRCDGHEAIEDCNILDALSHGPAPTMVPVHAKKARSKGAK